MSANVSPCPGCGERLGARYDGLCWPCFEREHPTPRQRSPRDPDWVAFRKRIIAALERDGTFFYINEDRVAGRCPICGEPLGVRFKGRQPEADLVCDGGCDERKVAASLGRART